MPKFGVQYINYDETNEGINLEQVYNIGDS